VHLFERVDEQLRTAFRRALRAVGVFTATMLVPRLPYRIWWSLECSSAANDPAST
jgi:hypothetical protein